MFRGLLLGAALCLYFVDADRLDFTAVFKQGFGGVFLWIIWISLVLDMLYRLIPNRRITIGARKHYSCSYSAASESNDTSESLKGLHKGALSSAIFWLAVSGTILFVLFSFNMLTPAAVLIVMLVYGLCDLIFILFFCPFQKLFMGNRCCTVCRIYNWDYFMMCAPLILFPGIYSLSLVLLSAAVLLRWEIALGKNPRFFIRETNGNLSCEACKDRLCKMKIAGK